MKRFLLSLASLLVLGTGLTAKVRAADNQLHTRPRYALQYGDALSLEYRYTPEFNQTVIIQPDGFVNLSLVGDLKVSGLTVTQVHDLILERTASRLNKPELNVVLKEFERPYVAVAGEVDKPGRLAFAEHTTALQAIMLSGGFKGTAQQSQVLVFRHVNDDLDKVIQLNLHHIGKTPDLERDLLLQPGDIVVVPRNKLENVARFVKAINLGLYLDPLTYAVR